MGTSIYQHASDLGTQGTHFTFTSFSRFFDSATCELVLDQEYNILEILAFNIAHFNTRTQLELNWQLIFRTPMLNGTQKGFKKMYNRVKQGGVENLKKGGGVRKFEQDYSFRSFF